MKTDLTKPLQTRAGRPARIVSEKAGGMYPIIAVIEAADGTEMTFRYTIAGRATGVPGDHPADLVNVPEKRVTYRTVRLDGDKLALGKLKNSSLEAARALIVPSSTTWHGVLRIETLGDRLTGVMFHDA